MNLPNKLTVLRVILIPFFLVSVLWFFKGHMIVALVFFALASITDFLDGKIARKNNLVTTFGKFLDPLADKLLVMTALIAFAFERWIDPVAVVLILSREFMVTGLRRKCGRSSCGRHLGQTEDRIYDDSPAGNNAFADNLSRRKGKPRPELGSTRVPCERGAYLDSRGADAHIGRRVPDRILEIHRFK